jgi:hypothetical protein
MDFDTLKKFMDFRFLAHAKVATEAIGVSVLGELVAQYSDCYDSINDYQEWIEWTFKNYVLRIWREDATYIDIRDPKLKDSSASTLVFEVIIGRKQLMDVTVLTPRAQIYFRIRTAEHDFQFFVANENLSLSKDIACPGLFSPCVSGFSPFLVSKKLFCFPS